MQRNPDPPDEKIPAKPFIEEKVPAKSIIEDLGNGITLEMVQIPAGTFLMGSPASESGRSDDEGPQHQVTVPAFLMGKFAVTQAQWRSVAGLPKVNRDLDPDPSHFKGANRPVEQVSWEEAVEFCDRLSRKTGKPYRLPSEAEWEYACRAGTTTPFHFGDTLTPKQAKCKANLGTALIGIGMNLTGVGTGGETAKVGSYPPNDFGLYDMHGNVWEWCADHWHDSYEGAPIDGSAWVTGGDSSKRLLRGGSWLNPPAYCRSALRGRYVADPRFYSGFRVACAASWTS
jgi:formylglycine-generating enzyme required for sulfatase activity